MSEPTPPPPAKRPLGAAVAVGIAVALAGAATCFFLIAIPFYTLGSFEPNGMGRPLVRNGLFKLALPVGVALGLVIGSVAGWWYRRGGSWTTDDGGDRYSNR